MLYRHTLCLSGNHKPMAARHPAANSILILAQENDVNDSDQRRHPRLKHRAKIKVIQPNESVLFFANMRDFSESGLFLLCPPENMPQLGDLVEVQTTEFEDAPIRETKVVRIEPGVGFGVIFL